MDIVKATQVTIATAIDSVKVLDPGIVACGCNCCCGCCCGSVLDPVGMISNPVRKL